MKKTTYLLIVIIIALLFLGCKKNTTAENEDKQKEKSPSDEEIVVVTTEFGEYTTIDSDESISGIGTELLREVFKRTNYNLIIKILPWNRALSTAEKNKNVIIYPLARTKQRENKYKWLGIIGPYDVFFYKLKSRTDIKFNSIDEAKKYSVGANIGSVRNDFFITNNFPKIENTRKSDLLIPMLFTGRFDIMLFPKLGMVSTVKKCNLDPTKLEKMLKVETLSSEGLYMAFGNNVSNKLIEIFAKTLKEIHQDGTYQNILNKYSK